MILATFAQKFKLEFETPFHDANPVFLIISDKEFFYQFLKMVHGTSIITLYSIEDKELEKLDSFFYKPTYRTSLIEVMERYDETLPHRIKGDFYYADLYDDPNRALSFIEEELDEPLPVSKKLCNRLSKSQYFKNRMKVVFSTRDIDFPTVKFLNPEAIKSLEPVMTFSGNKILPEIIDLRDQACFKEYETMNVEFNGGVFMETDAFFTDGKATCAHLLLRYWQDKRAEGKPEGSNAICVEALGDGKYLLHHENAYEIKRDMAFSVLEGSIEKKFSSESVSIDRDEMTVTTQKDELKEIVKEVLPEYFGKTFKVDFTMYFKEIDSLCDFLLSATQGTEYREAREFFEGLDFLHIQEEGLLIHDSYKDQENEDSYIQISIFYSGVTDEYGLMVYGERKVKEDYEEEFLSEIDDESRKYFDNIISSPLVQEKIPGSVASTVLKD